MPSKPSNSHSPEDPDIPSEILAKIDETIDSRSPKPEGYDEPEDAESPFMKHPFLELVKSDPELAGLREEYRSKSKENRREAAQWSYDSSMANHIFNQSLVFDGGEPFGLSRWPPGIEALAIDPDFAPAYLTVGSMEHQVGRFGEAMKLFRLLAEFPADTEDLADLIAKAGDFLLDEDDIEDALVIFKMGHMLFSEDLFLLDGYGYCLSQVDQNDEAIEVFQKGVSMAPDDAELMTDLGWAFAEAGRYDKAVEVTENAIKLAKPGYDKPMANLEEIRRRMNMRK